MRRPILLLAVAAWAQQPEEPTIRISVDLVQVDAIVTGRDRKVVRGLGIDDFELLQDGKPVRLSGVSFIDLAPPAAAAPTVVIGQKGPRADQVRRSITIVVDDLNLSHQSMVNARLGLKKFVEAGMAPGTLVCIMRTGGGAGNLQSFTSDKRQLLATIENMKWNPRVTAGVESDSLDSAMRDADSLGIGASRARVAAEVTELANDMRALGSTAAIEWAFQGMRTMPGRKSMVLITDGIALKIIKPMGGTTETRAFRRFQRLAGEAHRAGVIFYTIHAGGLRDIGLSRTGEEDALAYMPAQTGGRFLRDRNFVENDLAEIAEDQSGYYLIGYRPPDGTFDGKYHKIEVRTKRKDFAVRSRRELLGEQPAPPPAAGEGRELARALASPFHADGIPLRLTALHMVDGTGKPVVRCLLHIDARSVKRVEDAGAIRAELDVVTAGVDADGKLTASNANRYEARVEPAKIADLERAGFLYGVEYSVAKPGPYQIRVAVRDRLSGLLGSASQFLEIPDRSRGRIALSSVVLDSKRPGDAQATQVDPFGNPAVRRYRAGDQVAYALQLYNAGKARKLTSQVRLHRDGKVAFEGRRDPLTLGAGADPQVTPLNGVFFLGKSMPAGNYVAELRVNDESGRKPFTASQWIDFTVE